MSGAAPELLTDEFAQGLEHRSEVYEREDGELVGFVVRVGPRSSRSIKWWMANGKAIGKVGEMPSDQARRKAVEAGCRGRGGAEPADDGKVDGLRWLHSADPAWVQACATLPADIFESARRERRDRDALIECVKKCWKIVTKTELALGVHLAALYDHEAGCAFPGREAIAEKLGIFKRNWWPAVAGLHNKGLFVVRPGARGKGRGTLYVPNVPKLLHARWDGRLDEVLNAHFSTERTPGFREAKRPLFEPQDARQGRLELLESEAKTPSISRDNKSTAAVDEQKSAARATERKSTAKRRMELTDESVEALQPDPEGKVYVVWDTRDRRFGVRVHRTGLCTYFMRFSMPGVRRTLAHTLGSHGLINSHQARVLYRRAHMRIWAGIDPRQSRDNWRAEAWMRPGKAS